MRLRILAAAIAAVVLAVAASTAAGGTSARGSAAATKITVWLQNDAQTGWPEIVAAATRPSRLTTRASTSTCSTRPGART
jgi:hypothetical protein